jgi:acetyl-CoA carboxylase biotin carboxyl carrier protein
MDLNYVKKLVKLLSESDVEEIEIEQEGKKIRLVKHGKNSVSAIPPAPAPASQWSFPPGAPPPQATPAPPVAESPGTAKAAPPPAAPASPAPRFHEIKSPIVGTFYRAPAPDAAPFVQVGSVVEPGAVLCIVEAMKLMNEIESDIAGRVTQVLVENGQPVEYDQTLFLVEKL